ncbi:MAG TPA: hypothetical protein VM935_04905 [Chitinophagaceae bacterium]|nr:hypothetical protein [Chitinophagaceae bacterium]
MKEATVQQEILLMTGTSFSSRNWCEKDGSDGNDIRDEEMLKEACWNGLLPEMLPEICSPVKGDKKMFLWSVTEAQNFIDVEMGEVQEETERIYSINPYSFLQEQSLS